MSSNRSPRKLLETISEHERIISLLVSMRRERAELFNHLIDKCFDDNHTMDHDDQVRLKCDLTYEHQGEKKQLYIINEPVSDLLKSLVKQSRQLFPSKDLTTLQSPDPSPQIGRQSPLVLSKLVVSPVIPKQSPTLNLQKTLKTETKTTQPELSSSIDTEREMGESESEPSVQSEKSVKEKTKPKTSGEFGASSPVLKNRTRLRFGPYTPDTSRRGAIPTTYSDPVLRRSVNRGEPEPSTSSEPTPFKKATSAMNLHPRLFFQPNTLANRNFTQSVAKYEASTLSDLKANFPVVYNELVLKYRNDQAAKNSPNDLGRSSEVPMFTTTFMKCLASHLITEKGDLTPEFFRQLREAEEEIMTDFTRELHNPSFSHEDAREESSQDSPLKRRH